MLKYEVARLHRLDTNGSLKAFVDLSVNDELMIKGLRIIEGEKGLLVKMPMESGRDGKWYNTVIPLTREVKDEIEKVVLLCYTE